MAKVMNLKLDLGGKYGHRPLPIRNSMDMTKTEYSDFLHDFGLTMQYLRKWLNKVYFNRGIPFPYTMDEFYSNLVFEKEAMHILLEVEEHAALYYEDLYWEDE